MSGPTIAFQPQRLIIPPAAAGCKRGSASAQIGRLAAQSCFEVTGVTAEEVAHRLAEKRIRTSSSPYKISYARVAAGVMNSPDDIDRVLREIRALPTKSAAA
jgi:selenocysteine lyase/cysteine desulfurase